MASLASISGLPMPPGDYQRGRQRRLAVLRLAVSTFILASLLFIERYGAGPLTEPPRFNPALAVLGLNYLAAGLYYFVLPRFLSRGALAAAEILGDLAASLALVIFTGGADSPFTFLFIVVVVNCAFLAQVRGTLAAATLTALCWGALVWLHNRGELSPWLADVLRPESPPRVMAGILLNTGACFLVAVLGGFLSKQLFMSARALADSQANLDHVVKLNDSIIQSIDSGLVTTDNDGLVLSINQAALNILALDDSQIIGRPWQFILPELEQVLLIPPRRRDWVGAVGGLEFEHTRQRDNRTLILGINVLALLDQAGEAWGRLFVLKDLTSISRMEAEMKKAEHLAALGELAAGLAHELRTPLASMTGSWHMLSSQAGLAPEDQSRLMRIIGREMERLSKLASDFLSFAKPPHGDPVPLNLNRLLEDQARVFNSSKPGHVELGLDLAAQLPPIYFDRNQLSQVIWNLWQNALEAGKSQEKLNIKIETGLESGYQDYVALVIEDDGPGISPDIQKKIFEPFFTTKSQGSGLGLAIISRILHNGDGRITLRSAPGGGAIFTIYLPKAPGSALAN